MTKLLVRFNEDAIIFLVNRKHTKCRRGMIYIRFSDGRYYPGTILFESESTALLKKMKLQLELQPICSIEKFVGMNWAVMEAESKKAFSSAISNTITNISEVCTQTESIIIAKYGEDNFGTRDATESTPASCNSDIGDIVSDSFEMSALQNVSDMNLAITKVELEKVRNSANICNNITNINEVCALFKNDILGSETKYGEDNFGTRNATESTPASCNSDIGDIVPDNFEMSAVQNVPGPCILIEDIHFDAKGNIVKRKMYKNDSKIDENKFSGKKKEYCIFCKSFKTHLARHFTTCHKNERRVKNFMYLPLKSLERRKKIEELRKEGQLENNSQRNPELIMSVRRSKNKGTDLKDLRICPYCKGYYRRLRAHIPLCKADAKNKRNINVLGRQCSQNLHNLASDKIKSIFSVMRPDIVFSMISQDELVIRCANRWASKYRHVKDENMIRARARLIGRFLIEFNKLSENVHNFMDVFSPQLSDRVIKSINAVAGLETSEKYAFPNVARELGTLLKKCASIYNYILIENQEREKKKDLKDFCVLLEQNLSDSINKTVMENVAELRRQKVVTLPQESDITLLKKFVTNRAAVFFDRFQSDKTLSNYTNLASFVLVALIIFNRRRPGETERLLLKDFYSGSVAEYEELAYFRINIRGKLGRTVKLYLDKFQKKCVETLLQFRGDVGVEVSNPYVFGLPDIVNQCKYMRACPYFRKYSVECEAQQPELLRVTLLRKQVATKAANLQLNDAVIGDLADFMGHAEKIHRDHYRISEKHRELNVLNLLHQEENKSHNNSNIPEVAGTSKDVTDFQESSEYSSEESEIEDIKILKKRVSWNEEEKIIMSTIFSKNIQSQVPPSLNDCAVFKKENSSIKKPAEAVKAFIKNKISQMKRKSYQRLSWSQSEIQEVKKRFMQHLTSKKLPSEYECKLFLRENIVMKNRSPISVKLWIHNFLNKQKENKLSNSF